MNLRCIHCAGKGACGRPVCPIRQKIFSQARANPNFKKDFFGASPNIFVGNYGYPEVSVGLLSNESITENHDNPGQWSKENYQIPRLIDLRSSLINSSFRANVRSFGERFIEMAQQVSQSDTAVDVEVNLEKKPFFSLNYSQQAAPYGPSVRITKARITENPSIPHAVDKVVSDSDMKSVDAMSYLHSKGYDEHFITKVLTSGSLGVEDARKLVPTRWGITATDDTLGKQYLEKVRQYGEYGYVAHFGGYLGNFYLILFLPDVWGYELFETMASTKETSTDYEWYAGRKTYADNTAGGYYAARLAILEHLSSIRRQSCVLCLRFITEDYYAPLGVWVVREATRKSLMSKRLEFASLELMLSYARIVSEKKFSFRLDTLLEKSRIIKGLSQKKITEF